MSSVVALANPHRVRSNHHRRRRVASARQHYNMFRDYEPGTGRYDESDPIGLAGGTGTYVYVQNNPLNLIDRYGFAPYDQNWNTCIQFGLGSDCNGVTASAEMQELGRVINCARKGATRCIAICALKGYLGIDIRDPSIIEIYSNAWFEAAKIAVEREAKNWALKGVEHIIPIFGWAKTIYDTGKTLSCSWKCSKN